MDTDSLIVYIKKKTFTQTLWKDVEARFDTSNYELDGLLPKGKKRKSNCFNERWIRWKNNEKI